MQNNYFLCIRDTSSTYQICPISEKEDSDDEFTPYLKQQHKLNKYGTDSPPLRRIRTDLSHSYDNRDSRGRTIIKLRKSQTQFKEQLAVFSGENKADMRRHELPTVIHSTKKSLHSNKERLQRQGNKLSKLQDQMKKHKPVFFKRNEQLRPFQVDKSTKLLNLQKLSTKEVLLFDLPKHEQGKRGPIHRKQLKKLIQVNKMKTSLQQIYPPLLNRHKKSVQY